MTMTATLLPTLITAVENTINSNAKEVAELDRAIGDGDHVVNLQRGLKAIVNINDELAHLEWSDAFMKIGMTLMATMGGASGSLFGTLFISMAKTAQSKELNLLNFSDVFFQSIQSVKQRGKSDIGDKTMLDTLIPVANSLVNDVASGTDLTIVLYHTKSEAIKGMTSTKDLIATKGRASFLGKRTIGHIDAGARTSQLMVCAIVDVLIAQRE